MNKIGLIIKREYLTRVKKKTFVIMTILGPFLFAALMLVPAIMATSGFGDDSFNDIKIAVIDETRIFDTAIKNTDNIEFEFISEKYYDEKYNSYNLTQAKSDIQESDYYALLYIPQTAPQTNRGVVQLISQQQPNIGIKMHIANSIESKIEDMKLEIQAGELGITQKDVEEILSVVNSKIEVSTTILDDDGNEEESSTEIAMAIGYICGFLIYFFIFLFGTQVMRGVIEEKSNRIVEVIISSVKPFQLMMGKVIGVALVGLTQFTVWIILTIGLVSLGQYLLISNIDVSTITEQTEIIGSQLSATSIIQSDKITEIEAIFESIYSINFIAIIGCFLFYFMGGYLLYAAMFAIVGSAVDNETDTQQFMLPITLPMILAIFVTITAMKNPDGSLAYWFSLIPFTSPIVMMVRIPFNPPIIDVVISMALLIICFIFMIWVAAKIYRVGILMYGKKITYKELWKWFKYKN